MSRIKLALATVVLLAPACTFNEGGVPGNDSADASVIDIADAAGGTPDAPTPQADAVVVVQADAMVEPCPGDPLPFVPLNVGRCGMPEPGDTVIVTGGP